MSPAQQLGPYRLVERIGRGGMGEVWKAHDSRLGRDVAVKLSAEQFTDRFEKEARAIAALNHPNICTLFDVGPNYLVMELIDGPTLADRIAEGPIPIEEAIALARQIADALDAAHEKNIVHRDLKPGNIKVRPDGSVKVLDFGLAKSGSPEAPLTGDSPTMMAATQMGVILGTAAYMAPEQARGKAVDKRADIWAFGVVLCEMVTGKQLFAGEDLADTLASVVKSDPNLTPVPQRLKRLLSKCLQKEPKKRLRDIGDVWDYLDDTHAPATALLPSRLRTVWPVLAGVLGLVLSALAFVHFRETTPSSPVVRFTFGPPENGKFSSSAFGTVLPVISPDGSRIAFAAIDADGKQSIWIRPVDSTTAQSLSGTEGGAPGCWSADGQSLAFFAEGKLKRIDLSGGQPLVLADAGAPRGCSWNGAGTILFTPQPYGPVFRIAAAGGTPAPATHATQDTNVVHRFPWFLPDGRHFLYADSSSGLGRVTIKAGVLDQPDKATTLLEADGLAVFAQGYLLFARGTTLMARPFDPGSLHFTGDEAPAAQFVRSGNILNLTAFSVSRNGWLAYRGGAGGADQRLTWLDRAGKRTNAFGDPAEIVQANLSPDGKRVATYVGTPGAGDLWIYDLARALGTRFTFGGAGDFSPTWSPDGGIIVFGSRRSGLGDLYRKPSDGSSGEELLFHDNLEKHPNSFSPDGRFLAYTAAGDPKTGPDIWILPDPLGKAGAAKPYRFLATPFLEQTAMFSPDGKWIAYTSNQERRGEVYLAPFPGPGAKRRVSAGGGAAPRWRPDGRELYFVSPQQKVMEADINLAAGALVGSVHPLFDLPISADGTMVSRNLFDVSADGRFLAILSPEGKPEEPLTVVGNWTAGLKK